MAIYGDGKHDGGNIATFNTLPKRKKYWVLIDTPEFSESVDSPIHDIKNPFPELAKISANNPGKLDDFKKQDIVMIGFFDTKKERDEAINSGTYYDHDMEVTGNYFCDEIQKYLPTTVIFRKYTPENEVLALFPYEHAGGRFCTCYQHIGQHGACDGPGVVGDTVPATPEEYADLKNELEGLGYVLDIKKRINHRKYAEANK